MKLQIEELKWGWLTGRRFKVSAIEIETIWDGQFVETHNHLFDFKTYKGRKAHRWVKEISHLRSDIREWLESSLPYGSWSADHPIKADRHCALYFARKQDVVMFKLVWGGR